MITCSHMDKAQKETWLPALFDLYYDNMHPIAPSDLSYGEERYQWMSEVSPALDKAPRQVILCLKESNLLGYILYYTRGSLLMIEEFQLAPAYQKTLLFHRMCRYLYRNLPHGITHIEAYAHVRNTHSRHIMEKLGFQLKDDPSCPGLVHLQADAMQVASHMIRDK